MDSQWGSGALLAAGDAPLVYGPVRSGIAQLG